jgi:hypothetical protein
MSSVTSQPESDSAMSSSQKTGSKILGVISKADAERLLFQWVNLRDLPYPSELDYACRRFIERHPEVFGELSPEDINIGFDLIDFRDLIRRAWKETDRRGKDWYWIRLRIKFHEWSTSRQYWRDHPVPRVHEGDGTEKDDYWKLLDQPPPITEFEATVFYFQEVIADRAKVCGNPDCPAPYFIAVKRWQKFCSEKCAGPVNREQKRRWWHENKGKGSL